MIPALVLVAQVAAASPGVRVERIRDGGGRVVAATATIVRNEAGARSELVLFRRPGREDLVLCLTGPDAGRGAGSVHQLWTGRGATLRIERLADGRLSMNDGSRTLRWFEEDGATRTYRCAVRAVADARDPLIVPALEDYLAVKQALLEGQAGGIEGALLLPFRREAPPGPPLARSAVPKDDPELESLRSEAEVAFGHALRAR